MRVRVRVRSRVWRQVREWRRVRVWVWRRVRVKRPVRVWVLRQVCVACVWVLPGC